MEGLFLSPAYKQVWHHLVARYLHVRDLCALMACSRAWQRFWSSDGAWLLQRERLCAVHPQLRLVFQTHTGIYHVFRNVLTIGFNMPGMFRLFRQRTSDKRAIAELIGCVMRSNMPCPERWGPFRMNYDEKHDVYTWFATMRSGYAHFRVVFREDRDEPSVRLLPAASNAPASVSHTILYAGTGATFFRQWRVLVCEYATWKASNSPSWTLQFIAVLKQHG